MTPPGYARSPSDSPERIYPACHQRPTGAAERQNTGLARSMRPRAGRGRHAPAGTVMPPKPHAAEDRVVGGGVLIMRRQARAVRCQDGPRGAYRRARDTAPPLPRRAQGQPPPEQRSFHGIGHRCPRCGARDGGQQCWNSWGMGGGTIAAALEGIAVTQDSLRAFMLAARALPPFLPAARASSGVNW